LNSLLIDSIEIDKLHKHIGQNVMVARKKKGLSQLELTLAMGYKSVGLVSQAELYINKKHFNLEHLYKISKALDVSMTELLEGVDSI
jgi:transcriptional regulator with XRE-family HTH domain